MTALSATYSRLGYMAIKEETTENTAVIPNVFLPIIKEDVVSKYDVSISMSISANRVINLDGVPNAIPAPSGKVTIDLEPKTIGYLLKAVYGTVSSGIYLPFANSTQTFVAADRIVGKTSGASATVVVGSVEQDYVLVGAWSGTFVAAEYVSAGSKSGVLGTSFAVTAYGHQFVAPQTSLPTWTVEFGYLNEAVRYTGVRFYEMMVNQKENIVMGEFSMQARAEFKHARVTAITTAGATKTITVDQTTGLVATDTIKLFRPSTGQFVDFSASGVLTNTVSTIPTETTFTVANLQSDTAVGDLVVLAPQTPSYSVTQEFTWVGGSTLKTGSGVMTATMVAAAESIEDFDVNVSNELEERHAANGANIINRFPSNIYLKGLKGGGNLHRIYIDMTWLDRLRTNRALTYQLVHQALQIGATGVYYSLDFRCPKFILDAFSPILDTDNMLDQQMPYTMFNSTTAGYFHKALLLNDTSSY